MQADGGGDQWLGQSLGDAPVGCQPGHRQASTPATDSPRHSAVGRDDLGSRYAERHGVRSLETLIGRLTTHHRNRNVPVAPVLVAGGPVRLKSVAGSKERRAVDTEDE